MIQLKRYLLPYFLFVLVLNNQLYSQQVISDSTTVLKKGIYRNFEEFKYNEPSLPYTYDLIEVPIKSLKAFCSDIIHTTYQLNITVDEAKLIGSVFGFYDGENIYISGYVDDLKSTTIFDKLAYRGVYSYFYREVRVTKGGYVFDGAWNSTQSQVSVLHEANGFDGFMNSTNTQKTNYRACLVLDINTGSIHDINRLKRKSFNNSFSLFDNQDNINRREKDRKKYLRLYNEEHNYDGVYFRKRELTVEGSNRLIQKNESDTTIDAYYNRVYNILNSNVAFIETKKIEKKYFNKSIKIRGTEVRHYFDENPMFRYRVGVWQFYDKNAKLEKELTYDISGKKLNKQKFQ